MLLHPALEVIGQNNSQGSAAEVKEDLNSDEATTLNMVLQVLMQDLGTYRRPPR